MVWYGVVSFGLMWCGVVWYGGGDNDEDDDEDDDDDDGGGEHLCPPQGRKLVEYSLAPRNPMP